MSREDATCKCDGSGFINDPDLGNLICDCTFRNAGFGVKDRIIRMIISKDDMIRIVEETLHESKIEASERQILANVDSLQLVDLVMRLEDRLRLKNSIVSDSTFSRTNSPFLTIETLADFLVGVA